MLNPTFLPTVMPFYAVGNSPAISLTRSIPQGVDADVLLLGCGDARNVLYTAYAERGFPARKLDVTCCDFDDAVVARNVLFFSLLLDGSEDIAPTVAWDIYYHLYVSNATLDALHTRLERLLVISRSLEDWQTGPYGARLRFCDRDTLSAVREIWIQYARATSARDTPDYQKNFKVSFESSKGQSEAYTGASLVMTYNSARAAAPLWIQMHPELTPLVDMYWRNGTVDDSAVDAKYPNPLFAVSLTENRTLWLGSNPLLTFHLAAAKADLAPASPLRLANDEGAMSNQARIVQSAKLQFRQWISAFQDASERITLRFTTGDCFSLCHTLMHNRDSGELTAHWYRRQADMRRFELEESDYGTGGNGPKVFDIVDTSNLADHIGAANILISTIPLLKPIAWSTVYTEIMTRGNKGEKLKFESLLSGHTRTVSVLLGLSPLEYWANATCVSTVDEYMMVISQMESRGEKGLNIQGRLAWKQAGYISGQASKNCLQIEAKDIATVAHSIYLDMFSAEDISGLTLSPEFLVDLMKSSAYPKYHRGSLVALIKTVFDRVNTNQEEACRLLLELIQNDRTRMLGANHVQALGLEMSNLDLYHEPWLVEGARRKADNLSLYNWKHVPEAVAITLVIPSHRWKPVYQHYFRQKAGLVLEGSLQSPHWHNIYSDVQVAFGQVQPSGSRDGDDFKVVFEEDSRGFLGDSPLIATFYVAAAGLQADVSSMAVSLGMQNNAQNILLFSQLRDRSTPESMAIYETRLLDQENVFISKFAPNQISRAIVGGSRSSTQSIENLAISSTPKASFVANIGDGGDISTITGHYEITTEAGKKLLADKTPIDLRQTSPFAIDIVFGKDQLVCPLLFPVPVEKERARTRIARKSGYIEVIAPLADPAASKPLDDFLFPSILAKRQESPKRSIPATLNIPHLNLDGLPILDVSNKKSMSFLTTLGSLTFSVRERRQREEVASATRTGLSETSARLNFKESLFTMFMLSSGLQGGQTGLFAVSHPQRGGIHMLLFVSAIRLDGANASVVLDAAALPLTVPIIRKLEDFLILVETLECAVMTVDDAELAMWKKTLPALAERCRTWSHGPACEYARDGASVPLSLKDAEQVLCSCGQGKLPKDFVALPDWETASAFATRVAISPTFAVPYVEEVVDTTLMGQIDAERSEKGTSDTTTTPVERCRSCGQTEARGGGPLKKCKRCMEVKYCSAECQKKDWKKHRAECREP